MKQTTRPNMFTNEHQTQEFKHDAADVNQVPTYTLRTNCTQQMSWWPYESNSDGESAMIEYMRSLGYKEQFNHYVMTHDPKHANNNMFVVSPAVMEDIRSQFDQRQDRGLTVEQQRRLRQTLDQLVG